MKWQEEHSPFKNKEWQKEKSDKLMEENRHISQIKKSCPICGKITNLPNLAKYHGENICRQQ